MPAPLPSRKGRQPEVKGESVKTATVVLAFLATCIPAFGQGVIYNNGPDTGTIGAWPINYGHRVSNSFRLDSDSTVTDVVLSIWDVNERNNPETAQWKITTAPFGGTTLYSGSGILGFLGYFEGRLWVVWSMKIQNMNAHLPRGTYYLEVYDVHTRWNTWAFWGENDGIGCTSVGCPSTGYYGPTMPTGYEMVIGSESFQVLGTIDGSELEKSGRQ